ncbi:hypothetical protein Bpfe_030092 [Biomphalaria pfeifferi]|uniref:Uncharacterized protein n=1 Tax=Biomphalaria pfeifferi TaxID=112525 RepID=A0AAD8ARY3_BIOPF|nr:hypothetical protein Bpfe_030092 [Biomphalaria pfeifferi]
MLDRNQGYFTSTRGLHFHKGTSLPQEDFTSTRGLYFHKGTSLPQGDFTSTNNVLLVVDSRQSRLHFDHGAKQEAIIYCIKDMSVIGELVKVIKARFPKPSI